jgi:iron complex outermembrane receptor protein
VGTTGQQNINQGDYPYLPRYTRSDQFSRYQLGNIFYYTLRPEGYDYNIKWEETGTFNVGLDYGFANDKVYGSFDYYLRKTKDLINFIPVPAGTNLSNYILTNIGDLENKGFEFSIMWRPISTKKVFWEVGFNATYNKNEITKLTATDGPDYLGVETGGISGGVGNFIQMHSVGYPSNSFFVFEQVYDANGFPIEGMYVDRNGDGVITNDDRYHYKQPARFIILVSTPTSHGATGIFHFQDVPISATMFTIMLIPKMVFTNVCIAPRAHISETSPQRSSIPVLSPRNTCPIIMFRTVRSSEWIT